MKLVFLSDNLNFSGGRKLMLEYALFLRNSGHDVEVLVNERRGALEGLVEVRSVPEFNAGTIPAADIIVATSPREVHDAWKSGRGKVVHFCQGFEITDLEQRLKGESIPSRYSNGGTLTLFKLWRKKFSWRRKIAVLDKIYRLPAWMVTVSPHLKTLLESRYGKKVHLCRNGVHTEFFHPDANWRFEEFSERHPLRLINVGPLDVSFKGIPVTFAAMRKIRERRLPVKFIRVSPCFTESELERNGLVDECHENIGQKELGELFRNSDVYISNSLEGEGFGLPAMEALSCGLMCVLSDISSYRNFSGEAGFCIFVPQDSADATVSAVEEILKMPTEKFRGFRANALKTAAEYSHGKACKEFEKILVEIGSSGKDRSGRSVNI